MFGFVTKMKITFTLTVTTENEMYIVNLQPTRLS